MGDLNNNQFQPNLLHDIVNDTVAPSGVENEAYHGNNNVHRMNNREPKILTRVKHHQSCQCWNRWWKRDPGRPPEA